jgi:tyrosine-protein kinase Etk/Wzc
MRVYAEESRDSSHESAALRLLALLAGERRLIGGGTLLIAILTAIVVLVIPANYTATAVILVPQPSGPASALMGALGGGASVAALSATDGQFANPSDTYLGVLASRTVADDLIAQFDLEKVYHQRTQYATRKALKHNTRLEAARGWMVRISVEDHDARRAAAIANAYVDALWRVNRRLALTTGSQRRLFFEQQVEAERKPLADAEDAFREIQQKTGVIELAGQEELTLRSIAQIRAEIQSRELEVQMLRTTATEQNSDVQRLESEIAGLKTQLKQAEGSATDADDEMFVPAEKLPQAGLEYVRRARDLKYHEALFEMLSRQYEQARVDEAKDPALIQVVDPAVPPDKRSWPPRTLLVLLAAAGSAFLLTGVVLARVQWQGMGEEPANGPHLVALREVFAKATPPWWRERAKPEDVRGKST